MEGRCIVVIFELCLKKYLGNNFAGAIYVIIVGGIIIKKKHQNPTPNNFKKQMRKIHTVKCSSHNFDK